MNSCSNSNNILNSDCLIVNNNQLLVNKVLRWIIYQKVKSINFLDDFISNIIPDSMNEQYIPYIDIMEFNHPLPDYFTNIPATIFIMDGFISSPSNIDLQFQIEGSGFIIVLFDQLNNLIDYNNILQNQIILSTDTHSSSPKTGTKINNKTYKSTTISIKANTLYRISFIHYQNESSYTGLEIKTYYPQTNKLTNLDQSLLFSYAKNSSLNNTLMYKNNNNILNNYLRWDYFSQDQGDLSQDNFSNNNIQPPNSLILFQNNPLDMNGLIFNNRQYLNHINLKKQLANDISHKPYFKYIIDGYIDTSSYDLNQSNYFSINVYGGYIIILLLPDSSTLYNNILDVNNSNNIIFSSGITTNYTKSLYFNPGKYKLQIIYTSGNVNPTDYIGFDIQLNDKIIPSHYISTDYIVDFQSEYNNAILSSCGLNDKDWYLNEGCIDAINNSYLNEFELRNNNFQKFVDVIKDECKNITINSDPLLYNSCTKYNNSKLSLDQCFDPNKDLLNDDNCFTLSSNNKLLYQKYLELCSANTDNINTPICKKMSSDNNINIYNTFCTTVVDSINDNINNNNDDDSNKTIYIKKYLTDEDTFNVCRANMTDEFKKTMNDDLIDYCTHDSNLFNNPICNNLNNINQLKIQKCFNPNNIQHDDCQKFILDPNNLGLVNDSIVSYCKNNHFNFVNHNFNHDNYDNICDSFYNENQMDPIIKNDYYVKLVNNCSNLNSANNFITPNTKCYKIATDINIDPITGRSPMSYFIKNIVEYCSKGKNILSNVCQNNYNNLKLLVTPPSIKSNFSNQYNNIIYDNYFNSDIILLILLFLAIIIAHFIIKKIKFNSINNNKFNYLFRVY